ncbi:MAG: FtsH protease activity modulator HflK [Salinicola sp.]|uniref:FtsH protease activity modulator HflK n=1 Tax=Salinicola sp. TaxID=1978524 RepID=UPI000C8B4461|nr:FtsH protease activity modulator HflK [Salinicola sp.]MAM57871.1 FtsH protease activity modulator HflK [Salinicola sp.]NRB54869.1 FtsH protease activity modulator HflK [Salinicola sp.]
MAWNEPGGGNNQQDPWGGGGGRRPSGNGGNNGGGNQGPPDLDEALKKFQDKINRLLGGRGKRSGSGGGEGSGGGGKRNPFVLPILVLIVAVVIWAGSGFHLIDQSERGVVFRLGKYTDTLNPGLHWNPPIIDRVDNVNVTSIRSATQTDSMLTSDENIVRVSVSTQYVVSDAHAFLVNVNEPEMTLQNAMDSALRQEVGNMHLQEILTTGRDRLGQRIFDRLTAYMDAYGTGLRLQTVNVESTAPPDQVQNAFDDVIRAREERQRSINQANAYSQAVVLEAKGQRQRLVEEANGYKAAIVSDATGQTNRFNSLLGEYRQAPDVTRQRLYLETISKVLSNTPKALVDLGDSNAVTVLPLNQMQAGGNAGGKSDSSSMSMQQLEQISRQVVDHMNSGSQQPTRSSSLREGR